MNEDAGPMELIPGKDKRFIETEPREIPFQEIGEKYGEFRIIHPSEDESMLKSVEQYGQLSPLVVCRVEGNQYELLDGFKRLRAYRKLKTVNRVKVRLLHAGVHACKAAILQLNSTGKSISDMEEAMVVHSLYREDGLTQVEIATLLTRHKSWVCRRISMIERLCDEAQAHIKLGLMPSSTGYELAKLQRCNQESALACIQKHQLTWRETQRLVVALLTRAKSEHEAILRCPEEVLKGKSSNDTSPKYNRLSQASTIMRRKLLSMENSCLSVSEGVSAHFISQMSEEDILCLSTTIGRAIRAAELVVDHLKKLLSTPKCDDKKETIHTTFSRGESHGSVYP